MYKGDLSNAAPKRVLVIIDPILIRDVEVTKKLLVFKTEKVKLYYDKFLLNKFYLYGLRQDINLELVSFDHSDEELEVIYNEMDRTGVNPFIYWQAYKSVKALVKELPFRPEVIGVVDIPERRLMYGHWALDF
jgi:hypothetical protein